MNSQDSHKANPKDTNTAMKYCGPVYRSSDAVHHRYSMPDHDAVETRISHSRRSSSTTAHRHHRSLDNKDARSISPIVIMPSSRAAVSRSRRESYRTEDDEDDISHHDRPRQHPHRPSKFASKHRFNDPAAKLNNKNNNNNPFDNDGYCVVHSDVRLAKLVAEGWKILRSCPKCKEEEEEEDRDSNTTGSSFDSPPYKTTRVEQEVSSGSREMTMVRRSQHDKYDEQQQQHERKVSSRSSRPSSRRSQLDDSHRRRSRSKSRVRTSVQYNNDEDYYYDHDSLENDVKGRSDGLDRGTTSRRRSRIVDDQSSRSGRRSHRASQYDYIDDESIDNHHRHFDDASYDSRRRHRGRRQDSTRNVSRPRMSSTRSKSRSTLSRSSRSGGREHRSSNNSTATYISKPKVICVNGVPFDKNGCCFLHPHVKLASKKLLGGWKVHHTFCKACAESYERENDYEDDDRSAFTSRSSYTSRSRDTSYNSTAYSEEDRSRGGSRSVVGSIAGSIKSFKSNVSSASWTSNQSRKKRNDNSFLPLDEDGYCTHHPDVQLAKLSKRGEWKVLLDFCPECAEASLLFGGKKSKASPSLSKKKKKPIKSKHETRRSINDNNDDGDGSVKSSKSNGSDKTFVQKMPFIDNDGKPGHYTGYLNQDGRPNGRGKMKYVDGKKFDGIWLEGNQIQGKVSYKKKKQDGSGGMDKKKKGRRQSRLE